MTTEKGNKLIAEFMGYEYKKRISLSGQWSRFYKIGGTFEESFPYAKYHISWNWLMPVVEKIEKEISFFEITNKMVIIKFADADNDILIYANTKFQAVYEAVVKFITYYNQQPK